MTSRRLPGTKQKKKEKKEEVKQEKKKEGGKLVKVAAVLALAAAGGLAWWLANRNKNKTTDRATQPTGGNPAPREPVVVIGGFDAFMMAQPEAERQVPRIAEMMGKLDGTYRRTTPAAQAGRFDAASPPSVDGDGFFNSVFVNEAGVATSYRWTENTWSFYPPEAKFDGGITFLKIDKPPVYPGMLVYGTKWHTIPDVVKRNDNLITYR